MKFKGGEESGSDRKCEAGVLAEELRSSSQCLDKQESIFYFCSKAIKLEEMKKCPEILKLDKMEDKRYLHLCPSHSGVIMGRGLLFFEIT